VILLPELFETPYFCAVENSAFLKLARPLPGHPTIESLDGSTGSMAADR
jgi:predicted amidohydrolase